MNRRNRPIEEIRANVNNECFYCTKDSKDCRICVWNDKPSNICGDNRFQIIADAKADLIKSTNIAHSPEEMKVINNFLFRCWQMGWLDKYNKKEEKQ